MNGTVRDRSSVVRRLRARVGNPFEWSAPDKCIFVALFILPFSTWYAVGEYYCLKHPSVCPFVDQSFLALVFRVQVWGFNAGSLAIIATALVLRRYTRACRPLVHATVQLYFIGWTFVSYFLGVFSNLFTGVMGVGGLAFAFLLFDRRPVLAGLGTFVLGLTSVTVAEQLGLIPYAALLSASPVEGRQLSRAWLIIFGLPTSVIFLLVLCLIFYVVARSRDREEKLAETAEQLSRATELISRYIASQIAEQILRGEYEMVDKLERRRLTVFFSDIRDFTVIADQIEPEDLSRILNEYLAEMTAIAGRYRGTIDKFVGDAIMIFFGAPVATSDEDHAVRAVQMAIEMQRRIKDLNDKWLREGMEQSLDIRIGLNTGVASVGNFGSKGRMDYTAIGRQVNLAARLQANCDPRKILISYSTWVLVQGCIACVPKGEIQVKGIRNPVRVYEVEDGAYQGEAGR